MRDEFFEKSKLWSWVRQSFLTTWPVSLMMSWLAVFMGEMRSPGIFVAKEGKRGQAEVIVDFVAKDFEEPRWILEAPLQFPNARSVAFWDVHDGVDGCVWWKLEASVRICSMLDHRGWRERRGRGHVSGGVLSLGTRRGKCNPDRGPIWGTNRGELARRKLGPNWGFWVM